MAPMDVSQGHSILGSPEHKLSCLSNMIVVAGIVFLLGIFYFVARIQSRKTSRNRGIALSEQLALDYPEKADLELFESPLSNPPLIHSGMLAAQADENLATERHDHQHQQIQQVLNLNDNVAQASRGFQASTLIRDEIEIFPDSSPFGFWRRRTLEFENPVPDEQHNGSLAATVEP